MLLCFVDRSVSWQPSDSPVYSFVMCLQLLEVAAVFRILGFHLGSPVVLVIISSWLDMASWTTAIARSGFDLWLDLVPLGSACPPLYVTLAHTRLALMWSVVVWVSVRGGPIKRQFAGGLPFNRLWRLRDRCRWASHMWSGGRAW